MTLYEPKHLADSMRVVRKNTKLGATAEVTIFSVPIKGGAQCFAASGSLFGAVSFSVVLRRPPLTPAGGPDSKIQGALVRCNLKERWIELNERILDEAFWLWHELQPDLASNSAALSPRPNPRYAHFCGNHDSSLTAASIRSASV